MLSAALRPAAFGCGFGWAVFRAGGCRGRGDYGGSVADEIAFASVDADVDCAGRASGWVMAHATGGQATASMCEPFARGFAMPEQPVTEPIHTRLRRQWRHSSLARVLQPYRAEPLAAWRVVGAWRAVTEIAPGWRDAGRTPPSPALVDQHVAMAGPEDAEGFLAAWDDVAPYVEMVDQRRCLEAQPRRDGVDALGTSDHEALPGRLAPPEPPAAEVAEPQPQPSPPPTPAHELPAPHNNASAATIIPSQARVRVAGGRLPLPFSGGAAVDILLDEAPLRAMQAHALTSLCLLYTSPSPRDRTRSRMPSSA